MRRFVHMISACCICLLGFQRAHAQLPPLYEQYQLNQLSFNPAYAGSTGALETNFFLHRHSVNFEGGAPSTEAFTIHAPLANDKVGLGAKFFHDKIGVTNTTFFGVDYAYRIHISDNLTASIGLEASISNYKVDVEQLDAYQEGDPAFMDDLVSYWKPNAGAGLYLHSDNYYFGVSSISLFGLTDDGESEASVGDDVQFDQVNTLYATAGVLVPISDFVTLKPNTLLKMSDSLPTQLDAGLNVILNNMLMVGLSYRTNKSMSFVAQYMNNFDNRITRHEAGIGYSFNRSFSDDALFLSPSHEVFLIYRFDKHNNKFVNPRFF